MSKDQTAEVITLSQSTESPYPVASKPTVQDKRNQEMGPAHIIENYYCEN